MSRASATLSDARTPVLIGVGEIVDRPDDIMESLEPAELMARALSRADVDAGGGFIDRADSLDVVNLSSWRYQDVASMLCARLCIGPRRAVYGDFGGETPVRALHEAALRIARGESEIALICGAEAQDSVNKARRAQVVLPWTAFAKDGPRTPRGQDIVHPLATAVGVSQPVAVYTLYDFGTAAYWGQSPSEALAESGAIWSRYAARAAENPNSWLGRARTPAEIVTPTPANRLIAWPYTKFMVANPMVNQGAALVVTSVAAARKAGVPQDRMIYVLGGATARAPRDFLARDQYHRSHAQDAVLERALTIADGKFDALELYSCFPCVPKMARRALGLGPDVDPTVTGGLAFFGAPLSNYMTHAAGAMIRRLRDTGGTGLLYGQGEFVTKHHALVLSSEPASPPSDESYSVQGDADARRGFIPEIVAPMNGPARVESATVLHQRDGSVLHGVVVLRTPDGARTIAKVAAEDRDTLAILTAPDRYAAGQEGAVVAAGDVAGVWRAH